jgi:hypothetical protein
MEPDLEWEKRGAHAPLPAQAQAAWRAPRWPGCSVEVVADELSAHPALLSLVETVAQIAGVEAVALGGSRASGVVTEQSDWDFCVYYRVRFRD